MKRSLLDKDELYTVVHYLGTDVWLEIDQAPSESITGEGVYSHGHLNRLLSPYCYWDDVEPMRKIFRFNVETEEFEIMILPKQIGKMCVGEVCKFDQLVSLNGKLGFACRNNVRGSYEVELWKLNKEQWDMHCRISQIPLIYKGIMVSGFLNSDEDVLLSTDHGDLVVFCKKSDVLRGIEVEKELGVYILHTYTGMYCKKLFMKNVLRGIDVLTRNSCKCKDMGSNWYSM